MQIGGARRAKCGRKKAHVWTDGPKRQGSAGEDERLERGPDSIARPAGAGGSSGLKVEQALWIHLLIASSKHSRKAAG